MYKRLTPDHEAFVNNSNLLKEIRRNGIKIYLLRLSFKKFNISHELSIQQVNDRPNDHPLHEVWYTAMQEVLEHLAQTLLLEAFLEVLPGPPSSEDFQVQQKSLIVIIGALDAIQSPIRYKKLLRDHFKKLWPYRK